MRPKTKNTHIFHAQTTKNTKNKTTKKKNKQQQNNHYLLLLFYRIRVHYTVLTQHTTPTNNTHQPTVSDLAYQKRGDSIEQHSCCSRHPTACHTNKTNQNTNTLPCKTPPTGQPAEKASPCLCFINSQNPTHKARAGLVSPENKNRHHQMLTSTPQ